MTERISCSFSQSEGIEINTLRASYSNVNVKGGTATDTLTIRAAPRLSMVATAMIS